MTSLSFENGEELNKKMLSLKQQANEYLKIKERIRRHGENIVKPRGRPKTSASEKKNRRKLYLQRQRDTKKANGTYRGPGRPRKKINVI